MCWSWRYVRRSGGAMATSAPNIYCLALVREEYGMAAVILREAGLSLKDLRAKLISGLDQAA